MEKQTVISKIEVVGLNVVQVKEHINVVEDGNVIATSLNRYAVNPGDDYSEKPERVRAICSAVHTPEAIAEYEAKQSESEGAQL